MATVSAPYRFIPLSPLVVRPDWADQASQDVPMADGLSGELSLILTTHSPLCVGGQQDASSEQAPGRVHFFRTPQGQPAIPGSSLKGMLRRVMEIATFAQFNQVENQKLGVRDLQGDFYKDEIVKRPVQAGWLHFQPADKDSGTPDRWVIKGCRLSRLHQKDLIKHLGIAENVWKREDKKTAPKRYGLMGNKWCQYRITFNRRPFYNQQQAIPDLDGQHGGTVVVTGQPGKPFDSGKAAKKYEFVFHDRREQDPEYVLSNEVLRGFFHIYGQSEEWQYWNRHLAGGVPVFFHVGKDGAVSSLGLSMLYKIPYKHSLHGAIEHTSSEHLATDKPDLPSLIFGHLDDSPDDEELDHHKSDSHKKKNYSRRGRVSFGLAQLVEGENPTLSCQGPTVLSAPKPTFYPAYIRQTDRNDFKQLMQDDAELAGWKVYPPKKAEVQEPPEAAEDNYKVQVRMETVPEDTHFQFKLRFHNLNPVELGALLWCLDFGNKPALSHMLGMGKPYGLGQISLTVDETRSCLRPNDPQQERAPLADELGAARLAFTDMMEQALQAAGADSTWQNCGPIQSLLGWHEQQPDNTSLVYLQDLQDFVDLKKKEARDEVQSVFHADQPLQTEHEQAYLSCPPHSLTHYLQKARDKRQQEEAEEAYRQKRQNATAEDRHLMDLESKLQDPAGISNTDKGNINKSLRALKDKLDTLDEEQIQTLRAQLDPADAIADKKISKAVRAIRKQLEDNE